MKAAGAASVQSRAIAPSNTSRAWLWIGAVLIVCITELAYVPAMRGGFIWDDDSYIINNPTLRTADGLRQIWLVPGATPQYYPMVFTTFWIEYQLWELHPAGYHIVNVALHIVAAVLVWTVLARLGFGAGVAWVCAAIFAVHPVHAESVAWITERKNVLSAVFYLLSLLIAVRFFRLHDQSAALSPSRSQQKQIARKNARRQSPARNVLAYILMLALFIAALLSKSVTCSLPAVIALLIWWMRGRISIMEWLALAPMFVVGLVFALNTVAVEQRHVGVESIHLDYSFIERCQIAGRAIWFYVGTVLWPHPIVFIYPRWYVSASIWWQYLFPAAVVIIIVALWLLRTRIGRGPLVAVLIFCGTLVPALGFIDVYPMVYSFVADHFQYLASISLIVLFVATAAQMLRRWPALRIGLSAIVIAGLALLCFREGFKYSDLVALWTDTIDKNPRAAMAQTNLGNIYLTEQSRPEEAAALYRGVLSMNDPGLHPIVISKAHYMLGMYLINSGRRQEALAEFQKATALTPDQPRCYYGEGFALETLGRLDEAIAKFQRALELRPGLPQATEAMSRAKQARDAASGS